MMWNTEKLKNNNQLKKMEKIVIWFTWEMWCGKDTATEYLFKKYGWVKFKFSQSLREILERIWISTTRENLCEISNSLRNSFWQDILAKVMALDVERSDKKVILIDWVRRLDDIKHLSKIPGFRLIFIEADMNKRFNRIKIRWENEDELNKTFEEFKKDHDLETEVQIRWLKEFADNIMDNNWDFEDLYNQINEIINH
jgi:dephospho-CoA kinase